MACLGMLDWTDAIKYVMAGARTIQSCSAVMVHGYEIVNSWIAYVSKYLEDHGYSSINELRGKALENIIPPSKVKRGHQGFYAVVDKQKCTGCGICKRTCFYFAIDIKDGKAVVDMPRCDGCGLCQELCPEDAISVEKLSDKDLYPRPDSKPYNKRI